MPNFCVRPEISKSQGVRRAVCGASAWLLRETALCGACVAVARAALVWRRPVCWLVAAPSRGSVRRAVCGASAWLLRETALCGACVAAARVLACGGPLSRFCAAGSVRR